MKKETIAACSVVCAFSRPSLRAAALLVPLFGAGFIHAAGSASATDAPATEKLDAPSQASQATLKPSAAANEDAKALDPIVVIASRTPEHLRDVSPSASYVGEKNLIPAGNYTLSDVLREEQGVYTAPSGATGAQASIFTRGAESRMTQVTLDGRRLNSGFSNFDSSTLLMDNLSSVQLMRGASSTLYGANAMGGVIDLRSVDPFELTDPMASISGEGGSYGFWRTGFAIAGTENHFANGTGLGGTGLGFSMGGSWTQTDNKRPNNDYRMANIMPRLDYKVSDNLSFNVVTRYYDYDMGLPGDNVMPTPTDWQRASNLLISPGVKISLNDNIDFQAFYSFTKDSMEALSMWGHDRNDVDKHEFTMMGTWKLSEMIEIGGGYTFEKKLLTKRDYAFGSPDYDARRDSNSPWAQFRITPIEDLKISAGVRYNQFNTYDDAWTGEGNISYRIAPTDTTLHARVANAYATPDEGTLAYGYSSSGLKPEQNTAWEIGAKQKLDVMEGANLGMVYFENYFTDLIQWDWMTYTGYNIDKATTRGWEFSADLRPIDTVRLYANATLLKTENKQTGARLVRRPDFTTTIGAEFKPVETLTLGISATYVHGVEDIDAATYAQVDNKNYYYGRVYATWRFWEHAELFGRVENLFNQDYWTVNGYPALPINAYGGLRFTF